MRLKWHVAALALIAGACASPLLAANTVAVAPVTISAPFQKSLNDQYGAAEAAVLQDAVAERLKRALTSAGASVSDSARERIEVSIDDAKPSHPTRFQLEKNPSLDPVRSRSLGGARLHAVLKDADGKILDQVEYHDFAMSFQEASPSVDAWSDARVTIERFSDQVVKAWRRHAGH